MARRVFLHIGAPKSGTTYLQTIMWHNRPRLRELGYLYPGRNRMDHHNATLTVREKRMPEDDPRRETWARLTGRISRWPDTGILSHEFYGAATADQAALAIEHLAPAEVHLIFTARDYVSQLPAYWQEAVKMGLPATFSEYTKAMIHGKADTAWSWSTMDAEAILQRWTATVPADRVHVVTVPPPGSGRDLLWNRYASVMGIPPEELDLDVARANESMGASQAELLRRVSGHLPEEVSPLKERYRWLREELGHRVLVPQGGQRFGVRPEEAEALRSKAVKLAEYIEQAGFDVVGSLEELVPTGIASLPHPDDATDAELLQAAEKALAAMLVTLRATELERKQLRRKLKESEAARQEPVADTP